MLNKVSIAYPMNRSTSSTVFVKNNSQNLNSTNPVKFGTKEHYSTGKLSGAYQGYNNIKTASTVSFGNKALIDVFSALNEPMITCQDLSHGMEGEEVGSRVEVSELVSRFKDVLPKRYDAIKTNVQIFAEKDENGKVTSVTDARTQLKKSKENCINFEMVARNPRWPEVESVWEKYPQQILKFSIIPDENENTPKSYVLNTKGKLTGIIEDEDNVILTNAGSVGLKNGNLKIEATQFIKEKLTPEYKKQLEQYQDYFLLMRDPMFTNTRKELVRCLALEEVVKENKYQAFSVENVPEVTQKEGGSMGGGTEIIIGLQEGRFIPEIIDSIQTFTDKVNNGEIVLDKFVPAKNAENIQISMLAGGFGSRAEYANASSEKIMHGIQNGSDMTKGCFRTATGLTPMETTFISLHKSGLLDCSKGNLGIGKNIKFYLNDSGKNTGNGGFTTDMYNAMERENRDSLMIFPNDAMSRMPNAISDMTELMNSKNAAMVMIAKAVNQDDAIGKLGIMRIENNNEITGFLEKPEFIGEGYIDKDNNCFANTFQFAVSKEAFKALSILEPYLPSVELGKESRDWSKVLTPVLMAVTQNDDLEVMRKQIMKYMNRVKEFKGKYNCDIPLDVLAQAKEAVGDQKIYAVKTKEAWADCGTLNALYHTTMQIASGDFELEDFERKHVLDSVNTRTGLIASSPEQKADIESKYEIKGQVMVVPKAKHVSDDIVDKNKEFITRYSDKN